MELKDAFKYCPRCGAPGELSEKHLHCPKCGLNNYFSPKPAQEVVLKNDKSEYLFTVRGIEPQKGLLDFPGGFVEPGETFEQSARREVREELGVELGALEYLRSSIEKYNYQGVNYRVVGASFFAEFPAGANVKPDDDVANVEFYKLEDIPMDRLAWPTLLELIEILRERESKQN